MNKQVQKYHHPVVTLVNDQPTTTSLEIARIFGKEHYNVLRDIENIIRDLKKIGISEEFTALNFEVSEYTDSTGRKLKMYRLTEPVYSLTVMGFTGTEALIYKVAYIAAFHRMKEQLKHLGDQSLISVQRKLIAALEDADVYKRLYIDKIDRKPKKPVSQRQHDQIIDLKKGGLSTAEIVEKTGWSSSTITTHVKQGRERGELPPSPYGDERLRYPGLAMAKALAEVEKKKKTEVR